LGLDGPDLVRMAMVGANTADWSDSRWKERTKEKLVYEDASVND